MYQTIVEGRKTAKDEGFNEFEIASNASGGSFVGQDEEDPSDPDYIGTILKGNILPGFQDQVREI